MSDLRRRGFNTLKTVVKRLQVRDPHDEQTRWRTVSEITNYTCAGALSTFELRGKEIHLDLPVVVPEFTLRISGTDVRGVSVNESVLTPVSTRRAFASGRARASGRNQAR